MTRRHSILDASSAHPDLSVQQGGVMVTTIAAGLGLAQTVRGTIPVSGYDHRVQFIVYGASGTSLAGKVSIGLVNDDAPNTAYVGETADSIGYRVGEGAIYANGAIVDSAPAVGSLGCVVDLVLTFGDGGTGTVAWYLTQPGEQQAVLQSTQPLPAGLQGTPLQWAVTLGSSIDAGDISIRINSGAQDFESVIPVGEGGWWTTIPTAGALRIATQDYISAPTDDIPNTRWREGILAESAAWDMRFVCWVHGDQQSATGSAIQFVISDPDDRLLPLLKGGYRDKPMRLVQVEQGEPLSTAIDLGEFVFEKAEIVGDGMYRVHGRDNLALLGTGIQTRYFRPDVEQAAANRAMPTVIGPVFSFPVVLIDHTNRVYQIDSEGAEGVGKVRDMGDPLTPGTDYSISADGQTLTLVNEPVGIVTVDAAVTGTSYAPPPAEPDAIDNEGSPFTGVNLGDIDHFTRQIDSTPDNGHIPVFRTGGIVEFPQKGVEDQSYIEHEDFVFEAGKQYRVQFEVTQIAPASPTQFGVSVALTRISSQFGAYLLANSASGIGVYAAIYAPTVNHPLRLYYTGNNVINGTSTRVRGLTVWEIPPIEDGNEDETDEAVAELALPLAPMITQVLKRARKPLSLIEIADAEWLDAITGYAGQGCSTVEQMLVRPVLDELLIGYTAGIYRGRSGKLRIGRLFAPEDVADEDLAGELDQNAFLSDLVPVPFEARGLTKAMGARMNEVVLNSTDTTKLVTDLADVPLRLRAKLGRTHRYVQHSGVPLAGAYDQAETAEFIGSRLVLPQDAEAEIIRVNEIFAKPRNIWRTTMRDNGFIEPMQTYRVRYPRPAYGLLAGGKMAVHAVNLDPLNETIREVLFFALAPGEF